MRVKKGRSVDTGTLALQEQLVKAALPVLLSHPTFQRQQLVCRLLCVSKTTAGIVVAHSSGAVNICLDATWQCSSYRSAGALLPIEQFITWVRKYSSLIRSLDLSMPYSWGYRPNDPESALATALQQAAAGASRLSSAAAAAAARGKTAALQTAPAQMPAQPAASPSGAAACQQQKLGIQASFQLQSFKCSYASDMCPAVVQQLPVKHLTKLELHFGHQKCIDDQAQNRLVAAVSALTGLVSLSITAPQCGIISSRLMTGLITGLRSLTQLSFSEVDYQLLDKLPTTLVDLSLGPVDKRKRVEHHLGGYRIVDNTNYDDDPTACGPLRLTQLTALTRLRSKQLCLHDQLPAGLQDVAVDYCYNVKPLLGLTGLRVLSLGSPYRLCYVEDDGFDSDDYHNMRRGRRREPRPPQACYDAEAIDGLQQLSGLTGLSELRLKYNRVETAEEDWSLWHTLPALKSLQLAHIGEQWTEGGSPIKLDEAYRALSQLKSLTSLRLDAESYADTKELGTIIKQLTDLQDLAANNLWEVSPVRDACELGDLFEHLTCLHKLRKLECNMPVTTAAAKALAKLTMVTNLDLTLPHDNVIDDEYDVDSDDSDYPGSDRCPGLNDRGLAIIVQGLTGLKQLVLEGNKITNVGIADIQRCLPELKRPAWPAYSFRFAVVD